MIIGLIFLVNCNIADAGVGTEHGAVVCGAAKLVCGAAKCGGSASALWIRRSWAAGVGRDPSLPGAGRLPPPALAFRRAAHV